MKIMIVTDAWEPQVNGVVRTLKMTTRHLQQMGHSTHILSPQDFRSVPCPTYPEISLALASRAAVARHIDRVQPDCLHIATEGPLGWAARGVALRRGWPFTTAYHSRFPEYVQARVHVPLDWSYALLRRFHNAAQATLAPTPAIVTDLVQRGFTRARLWSRGVNLEAFTPQGPRLPRSHVPVFLYVGRLAVEKQVQAFLSLDLPGSKIVVGDGPARKTLAARFPQAHFLGAKPRDALAIYYSNADVFVFPSLPKSFFGRTPSLPIAYSRRAPLACADRPAANWPAMVPMRKIPPKTDGAT